MQMQVRLQTHRHIAFSAICIVEMHVQASKGTDTLLFQQF